ncbi:haloalkane dehalogenase [Mameliella sp. AT18]|uniref:haloalkane dehalogenase n=1 Tax=Mameliella sp. AT18 TaxID=3028385 RepID=UPI000841242A|nr:haloalkane dehalogenase [Mameliella sp. AT18]MDD9729245.1 haloalkane dehalogenase [Mameliella sp. AT18]ODM47508.1 haloalkane dehalogenase [Ruegeria sp. PBVC088]
MPRPDAIRTPDACFADLPDFPWQPRYRDDLAGYEGLRMARIDEGPEDADRVFLCLHGQPAWSFLYRHMIPVFLDTGARVVAPDLYGFGRSDKPVDDGTYTFNFHRQSLVALIEALDLRRITLVVQDWGGILGLTIPPDMADRFDRLLVMDTVLGLGGGSTDGFDAWRRMHGEHPDYDMAALFMEYVPGMSDKVAAAYAAPFPDARYRAGARRFPFLVMTDPDMEGVEISRRAARWWSSEFRGDSFMAVGEEDKLIPPWLMKRMHEILGITRPPLKLSEAGHFVQETHGADVARAALAAWAEDPEG